VQDKQRAATTVPEEETALSLSNPVKRKKHDRGLWLIALFKLVKAALLLVVAIGALKLIHDDVAQTVAGWVASIRIDPENRFIHRLFVKLAQIDDRKLEAISAGSFFYATLLAVEGVGLWMEKRWAEYLTVIATASFIPLEIYEIIERLTVTRVLLLAFNIGVVIYLIKKLRERNGERPH